MGERKKRRKRDEEKALREGKGKRLGIREWWKEGEGEKRLIKGQKKICEAGKKVLRIGGKIEVNINDLLRLQINKAEKINWQIDR